MTAEAQAVSPAELSSLPAITLSSAQLGDTELLLSGALAPLTGFMTSADADAVAQSWQLADGTPFPVPVTLDVAAAALPSDTPLPARLLLSDPEGTPLAGLTVQERTELPSEPDGPGLIRLAGPVSANRPPEHGPFRRLMLSPAATRAQLTHAVVLAFATRAPLSQPADRPAPAPVRPAARADSGAAAGKRARRGGRHTAGADPGGARRDAEPARRVTDGPGPASGQDRRWLEPGSRSRRAGQGRGRVRRDAPDGRRIRAGRGRPLRKAPTCWPPARSRSWRPATGPMTRAPRCGGRIR